MYLCQPTSYYFFVTVNSIILFLCIKASEFNLYHPIIGCCFKNIEFEYWVNSFAFSLTTSKSFLWSQISSIYMAQQNVSFQLVFLVFLSDYLSRSIHNAHCCWDVELVVTSNSNLAGIAAMASYGCSDHTKETLPWPVTSRSLSRKFQKSRFNYFIVNSRILPMMLSAVFSCPTIRNPPWSVQQFSIWQFPYDSIVRIRFALARVICPPTLYHQRACHQCLLVECIVTFVITAFYTRTSTVTTAESRLH